jgi:PAS domain S-box-containing protein
MNAAAKFPWLPPDPKTDLRSLFENAPFALTQCQRQGNITALNAVLEQVLGAKLKATQSLSLADLMDPQAHAQSERLLRELFAGERGSFQIESRPLTANGCPVRWTAWRVAGTNGAPDYAMALAEDEPQSEKIPNQKAQNQQSDSREYDQRIRRAEGLESVGRLAGGVVHDFNNLLTGVLLYCDLLLASLEPGDRVRKYAEEIRNAGLQAAGLVRQLLEVARPASSGPRPLSLNEIAEGMRNLLARLVGENIELQFHLDPNLGSVKMDPTQAQQILLNLALNARDALPGGGRITVETSNCQVQVLAQVRTDPGAAAGNVPAIPCAIFVVRDNGIGMDAVTRSHLFETFFTTKPAGKGTGLGLATVHDIVTSNGGLIHVESAPSSGTRVTVLLPLVSETAPISQCVSEPEQNEGVLPATE